MDGGAAKGKGKVDEVEKDALGSKAPAEGEGAGEDPLGSKEEKQGEGSNTTNRKRDLGATDLVQPEAKKKKEQEQEQDSTDKNSSVDACDIIGEDLDILSPLSNETVILGNSTTSSHGPDASEDFISPDATEGISSLRASKDHGSGGEQM